jgi:phage host-nuclease inhibitor protein Gam
MKQTVEDNNKRIDILQKRIKQLKDITDEGLNLIGEMQEELQAIQSENAIMAEEMKAGKHLES